MSSYSQNLSFDDWIQYLQQKPLKERDRFLFLEALDLHPEWIDPPAHYESPLVLAAENAHLDLLEIMIDKGMDINRPNLEGLTACIQASRLGYQEVVKLLLHKKADVSIKSPSGSTAFMEACSHGRLDLVQLLFEQDPNINQQNHEGVTPLMMAASHGNAPVAQFLIDHGALINTKNQWGWTALTCAFEEPSHPVFSLLIDAGADVNLQTSSGHTALFLAVLSRDLNAVQTLFQAGAVSSLNLFTETNIHSGPELYTPLMLASALGYDDMVHLLIQEGADRSLKNSLDQTPLILAAKQGHLTTLQTLLLYDSSLINHQDIQGCSALMWAAKTGQSHVVQFLVDQGADLHLQDVHGLNAIDFAYKKNHSTVFDILNDHGAIRCKTQPIILQ